ncbi:RagB/SusD family nutrient uptake outer membrane protein [Duncaniella freteri]|uniref:RagB/SusD family nutrient uptake outer membrane protein n=1 Tax=Duncaniella freteri TaxID=2530391 RepID=UPI0023C46495|nr:RagB/SusD family nutrient uptake outer membrane protein [Duncaniella freteri]MDE7026568.1 RagB/SusD family nutrient uptake outer membrane protein [Duncaniella freteri]
MKKSYILPLLLGLAVTVTSCEDFLTEQPEHQLTVDNAARDYTGAKNLVNGIYGRYIANSNLGGEIYGKWHDMAGLWNYNSTMLNMAYTQTNNNTSATWKSWYDVVNASNVAITGVSNLADNFYPSVDAKNALLAEARFFRGYAYLHLMWGFTHWFSTADSPYGLLYRDMPSELSNLMVERISVGDSYQKVIDDLEFAISYLADYDNPRHVSKQFAQAMLAKLYLYRGWDGDYAKSLDLVNTIFKDAPAKFKMEPVLADLYENAWDSNELLFGRYLGDGSGFSWSEFTYSYGLYYNKEFGEITHEWIKEDPRYAVTFGEARSPETWQEERKDDIPVKLYHRGRVEGLNDKYTSYNFRYAELYIMKAELLALTNPSDISGALAELNKMRATYTDPVLPAITGVSTHEQLMDEIFKEYVVTLIMENESPWFAAVRIEHEGRPWIYTLKPDVNFSTNQYCWPIPDDEIKAHSNKIDQNPGLE